MQGRENTGEERAHLELLRSAYPNNSYSAQTGGIMHNLRTSTTNKKVRDFHRQFYRADNLVIIITGPVEAESVFKALEETEQTILNHGKLEPFDTDVWKKPVPPLGAKVHKKIVYSSDEEDCGLVYIGWRGPRASNETLKLTATNVLLRYLSDTSVSPLHREFIEVDDPYASKISCDIIENAESLLYCQFENVPIKKIDLVFDKLFAVLKGIASGEEKLDMTRFGNIIERQIMESLSNLENEPHESVSFLAIADSLYGSTKEDFELRLNHIQQLEHLRTCGVEYWLELMNKYLINVSMENILGFHN